ncbi:MAG TPA: hypothetical protein VFM96_12365 [Gaiellaceae bacterium]|nr:hypothetical protein [Gaiellaceae bacterium]
MSATKVGEPAPPLDLPDLSGTRHRLADLRGRAMLIVFFRHAG